MRRFLLFFIVLFSAALSAETPALRVALGSHDVLPPRVESLHGASRSGSLAEFNEELAREICRRLKVRCVVSSMPFAEILPGVEAQRYDLGFGNYLRTPEREKRVAFSDPILRSSSRLIGSRESIRRFASREGQDVAIERLRRARLSVVGATQQEAYLNSVATAQELTVSATKTMSEAFALLREGKVDFALLPVLSAYTLLSAEPDGGLEFVGPGVTQFGLGGTVHLIMPRDDDGLRKAVNEAIAGLRADGTYHRIVRRFFPLSSLD